MSDATLGGGPRDRYTAVAIVLHWLIAFAIIGLIAVGFYMSTMAEYFSSDAFRALPPEVKREYMDDRQRLIALFQMHKSFGLTVLALSLVRLGWRLSHRPPPLPASVPGWQRAASAVTHIGFYVIMIAAPLSGWAYVSSGFNSEGQAFSAPTMWFGLFEVPHIPFIVEAGEEMRKAIAASAYEAHELLAYATIALLILHIGAALKHQFIDRDGLLNRMSLFATKSPKRTT